MKKFPLDLLIPPAIFAAVLFLFWLCAVAIPAGVSAAGEKRREMREAELQTFVYPSWKKAHPGLDLTYSEWRDLHKENLLPK